mgnify:CR=1 FL=1
MKTCSNVTIWKGQRTSCFLTEKKDLMSVSSNCELAIECLIFFFSGCEVIPDVNVNKEKFNIKIKLKEAEDIEVCCSSVSWLGLFYNECQF